MPTVALGAGVRAASICRSRRSGPRWDRRCLGEGFEASGTPRFGVQVDDEQNAGWPGLNRAGTVRGVAATTLSGDGAMRLTRRLLLALLGLGLVVVAPPGRPRPTRSSSRRRRPRAKRSSSRRRTSSSTSPSRSRCRSGRSASSDVSGRELDVGEPRHPSGDDTRVVASAPDLGDGSYVVAWRVVSADSHPINGAFTFDVGAGGGSGDTRGLVARLVNASGSPVVGAIFAAIKWAGTPPSPSSSVAWRSPHGSGVGPASPGWAVGCGVRRSPAPW